MNDYLTYLSDFFKNYARKLEEREIAKNIEYNKINIDYFSKSKKGDISSNFYLIILNKILDKNFKLKEDLVYNLEKITFIKSAEIPNTNFINIFLYKEYFYEQLKEVINEKNSYGNSKIGNNQNVNIEFVSANPTGPIHVAHMRGAVFGDVLASIFNKTGYNITREYYVNDSGTQIDILSKSLYKRYCQIFNMNVSINNDEYPGDYLKKIAKKISITDSDKWLKIEESKRHKFFKDYAVRELVNQIRNDLQLLNINFDIFTYESNIQKQNIIDELFVILNEKKLLYEGILDKPKTEDNSEWEPRKQLLFKSTNLFDDRDRPLKKANGEWTYFANDAAYHYDKYKRKFDIIINVWGADHIGYVPRMKSIVSSITNKDNYLEILICQIVRLMKNSKILKMSKREGNFITLNEIFDKVGKDPLRYFMISTRNETSMDFDLDKVVEKNKDNNVFYCQYAYARACSVLNKAKENNININLNLDFATNKISDYYCNEEWEIILKILSYPYILNQSSLHREPHRLTNYIENLSSTFHSFWNKGKDDESLRFIQENNILKTQSKLIWLYAFKITLKNIFDIIGIDSPESM